MPRERGTPGANISGQGEPLTAKAHRSGVRAIRGTGGNEGRDRSYRGDKNDKPIGLCGNTPAILGRGLGSKSHYL